MFKNGVIYRTVHTVIQWAIMKIIQDIMFSETTVLYPKHITKENIFSTHVYCRRFPVNLSVSFNTHGRFAGCATKSSAVWILKKRTSTSCCASHIFWAHTEMMPSHTSLVVFPFCTICGENSLVSCRCTDETCFDLLWCPEATFLYRSL